MDDRVDATWHARAQSAHLLARCQGLQLLWHALKAKLVISKVTHLHLAFCLRQAHRLSPRHGQADAQHTGMPSEHPTHERSGIRRVIISYLDVRHDSDHSHACKAISILSLCRHRHRMLCKMPAGGWSSSHRYPGSVGAHHRL